MRREISRDSTNPLTKLVWIYSLTTDLAKLFTLADSEANMGCLVELLRNWECNLMQDCKGW